MAPKFAELNDDVLFGEVWAREEQLSARDRSMVTMEESYAEGSISRLPGSDTIYPKVDYIAASGENNYIVSVDPKGTLAWKSNTIEKKNRPKEL